MSQKDRNGGIRYEYHFQGGGSSITSNLPLKIERTADGSYSATSCDQEHRTNIFISGEYENY